MKLGAEGHSVTGPLRCHCPAYTCAEGIKMQKGIPNPPDDSEL